VRVLEVLPDPCINANIDKSAVRMVRASDNDSYQTNERACGEWCRRHQKAGWKECLWRKEERKGTRVSMLVFKLQLHVGVYYTELRECVVERSKRERGRDHLHGNSTVSGDLRLQTPNLAGGEVVLARIVGVVHVVMDGWKRKRMSDRTRR